MTENWREIKGYEGLYEVSNWGRVRSLGMWTNIRGGGKRWLVGRMLRPVKHNGGYLLVNLYKDGVHKLCLVHRLVAEAFISNPNTLPEVNHKDEVKTNNRVENLEWCDGKYNTTYTIGKTVYMYTIDDKLCGMWSSTRECERNGFKSNRISECCNGKLKTHKGFKWSYEPPMPPKALPYPKE